MIKSVDIFCRIFIGLVQFFCSINLIPCKFITNLILKFNSKFTLYLFALEFEKVAKFYSDKTLNYLVVIGVGSCVHWSFDRKLNFEYIVQSTRSQKNKNNPGKTSDLEYVGYIFC